MLPMAFRERCMQRYKDFDWSLDRCSQAEQRSEIGMSRQEMTTEEMRRAWFQICKIWRGRTGTDRMHRNWWYTPKKPNWCFFSSLPSLRLWECWGRPFLSERRLTAFPLVVLGGDSQVTSENDWRQLPNSEKLSVIADLSYSCDSRVQIVTGVTRVTVKGDYKKLRSPVVLPNLNNICPYHTSMICACWLETFDVMNTFSTEVRAWHWWRQETTEMISTSPECNSPRQSLLHQNFHQGKLCAKHS